MTRQDINQNFLREAFLDGANATYVEALQARYEKDPNAVEASWREFFGALGDDAESVEKTVSGPSWEKPNWPQTPSDDLTHALDGDWPATEKSRRLQAEGEGDGDRGRAAERGIRSIARRAIPCARS